MFRIDPRVPPHAALLQITSGQIVTHAIATAAHLNIADILKDGPRTADEVASATGAHARSVYRLMRALAGVGLFEENERGAFSLTPLGETLRTDLPGSLNGAAKFFGTSWHARMLSNLLYSVRTGKPAFEEIYAEPIFDWLPKHPEEAKVFYEGMTGLSKTDAEAVVRAYDFSGLKKVADIGGGQGFLLAAILTANPGLYGAVYDLPSVVDGAKQIVNETGLQARCEVIAGDFFQTVPTGFDAYLLKYVLHDWDDETCIKLLQRCARALSPGGRLLVIEQVLPERGESALAQLIDLAMLTAMSGAGERTEREYSDLFEKAGLKLIRIIPTLAPAAILEVVRQ